MMRAPGQELVSISVISDDNIWVAGDQVLAHWDGSAWTTVPNGGGGLPEAVSADSSDDVWAVGQTRDRRPALYAEHWDGSAWSDVAMPHGPGLKRTLYTVSADAADDAWATGRFWHAGRFYGFIEHWDGTSWATAQRMKVTPSFVNVVSVLAPDDVWAVAAENYASSFAEHWNGTAWQRYDVG